MKTEEIKFKGTPGPWEIDKGNGIYPEIQNKGSFENSTKLTIGVFLYKSESVERIPFSDENKANARLIAAAPELFQTLKEVAIAMEGNPEHKGLVEKAREVLEKATGCE